MASWKGKGVIACKDLRSIAGTLLWLVGIVPRVCWEVSILYAVVALVESDAKQGLEAARARAGLVAVKRNRVAGLWLLDPEWLVVADASP